MRDMNEDGRKINRKESEFEEKDINKFIRVHGVVGNKSLLNVILVQEEDRKRIGNRYLEENEGWKSIMIGWYCVGNIEIWRRMI